MKTSRVAAYRATARIYEGNSGPAVAASPVYRSPEKDGNEIEPVPADRQRLVEMHLAQVRYVAERLLVRLPPSVDRDDLISAGVIGLLDAVTRFDPGRGVVFRTFAELRIRGAMLDSLRGLDWAPRQLRHRARELESASHRLEQQLGRAPEVEEICAELHIGMEEYAALLATLHGLSITDLESEEAEVLQEIPDQPEQLPSAQYERQELRERLAAAIAQLPERERQVIALYYQEELTMKETGAVLGLTESRVSQIHTQAVIRLRGALQESR